MRYFIISLIFQVALVIHILRTGRPTIWVWIVLVFPPVGPIVYIIMELVPDISRSRAFRQAGRGLKNTLDPNGELRNHSVALQVANTIDNTINLANALRDKGSLDEALELYNKALKGMYQSDPTLLLGKAEILYRKGLYSETCSVLDYLIRENPDFKSADGHLLYARALEADGKTAEALHEYETLARYYPGPEARCRYGMLLKKNGELEKASGLFNDILLASKQGGSHYNKLHREWVAIAKRETSQ